MNEDFCARWYLTKTAGKSPPKLPPRFLLTSCVEAKVSGADGEAEIKADHGPSKNQSDHSHGSEEKQAAFAGARQT